AGPCAPGPRPHLLRQAAGPARGHAGQLVAHCSQRNRSIVRGVTIMRKTSWIVTVAAVAVGTMALSGHGREPNKVAELMQRKLERSQKVLEGVATNDFDKIAKNAEELIAISKAVEWRVIKSPRYELYSNEFQRTADTLVKNAKEKNLDDAALSYVELTLNCVKCHKYVREVRMVRLDDN